MSFREAFPTLADFLAATPEDVGVEIVLHMKTLLARQSFNEHNDMSMLFGMYGITAAPDGYAEVWQEGIEWAKHSLLIMPDPRRPPHGWIVLTRDGRSFARDKLNAVRLRQIMPEYLLHPKVREVALDIFNTGHYQNAVFEAFKAFEVATREAANLDPHSYGDSVMKDAFHYETGVLHDPTQSETERLALMNFVRGAYGLFKNPRSHRNLDLVEAAEAAEMMMVASHLLRIVDAAKQRA